MIAKRINFYNFTYTTTVLAIIFLIQYVNYNVTALDYGSVLNLL